MGLKELILGRRYYVEIEIVGGRIKEETLTVNGIPYEGGDPLMDKIYQSTKVQAENEADRLKMDPETSASFKTRATSGGVLLGLKNFLRGDKSRS